MLKFQSGRGIAAILAAPLLLPAAPASATSCAWTTAPSPSPGSARNILFAVTGAPSGSMSRLWAVGYRGSPELRRAIAPVVDYWNGLAWRATVLPGRQSNLLGIYAAGPANVWAVGFYSIEDMVAEPVVDHFTGHSWVIVPSPRFQPNTINALRGIAGTSAHDIWAVGMRLGRPAVTITEHFGGHTWRRVPSPSPARASYIDFAAIKALSARDVWVAGDYVRADGIFRTLVEHYNGTRWRIVPSPNIGPGSNYLSAITGSVSGQIWAVGRVAMGGRYVPLALHWNGHHWTAGTPPARGSGDNALNGLTSTAKHGMWAVGSSTSAAGHQRPLIEHYDGSRWRIESAPDANPAADNVLYAATTARAQVWAVGGWSSPARGKTVTMRRCLS